MDFELGQVLGDYEILRVLGAGGMGKVYQVRNNISHRVEAMKVLLPDLAADSELVDRFLREIRISASLDHPNIAALRTAQRVNNQLVMVMEYVEGSALDSLMRAGRIPIDKAVDYTAQALLALSYAHSKGVTHRDIKPGNIMLTPSGMVKLMDFGIARLATDVKLTKTGMMVGSVYYVSPEQIEGRDLDARSDIYSLGITLYQIVTGKRPFNGDSEYQIMAAHLKGMPQPPREIDQSLPKELNDIILMALAKDPARRFQSADAFRAALSSLGPAAVASPLKTAAAPAKRDRRLMYMAAGSVATIAVIAAAVVELPKYWHASAGVQTERAQHPAQQPTQQPSQLSSSPVATPAPSPVPAPSAIAAHPNAHPRKSVSVAAPLPMPSSPMQSPPVQAPVPITEPVPASAPAVDTAELSGLRERMMLMAARIGAAATSIQSLQSAQAQQGVGLRSDIVAARQRVNYQMGEAESNLNQSDAAGARKRLDVAERDLEKLESFLGK